MNTLLEKPAARPQTPEQPKFMLVVRVVLPPPFVFSPTIISHFSAGIMFEAIRQALRNDEYEITGGYAGPLEDAHLLFLVRNVPAAVKTIHDLLVRVALRRNSTILVWDEAGRLWRERGANGAGIGAYQFSLEKLLQKIDASQRERETLFSLAVIRYEQEARLAAIIAATPTRAQIDQVKRETESLRQQAQELKNRKSSLADPGPQPGTDNPS